MIYLCKYFIYLIIYSFFGYICEVIYCSIGQKKLVNRGFLYSPICPIYGFGALSIILPFYTISTYKFGFIVVIVGGFLLTSLLEYVTSYVMEKMFKLRWWDYSHYKYNINGRVCLKNSLLFTVLTVIVIYLVHPIIVGCVGYLSNNLIYIISSILIVVYMIDLYFSVKRVVSISSILAKSEEFIKDKFNEIKNNIEAKVNRFMEKFPSASVVKTKFGHIKLKEYINRIKNQK